MMVVTFQTYGQSDWTLLKEEQGVKVFYKIATCQEQQAPDPTNLETLDSGYDSFHLKIVNENDSQRVVTFSKETKTNGSNQLETLTVSAGTTKLETCEKAPKLILTQKEGDNWPIAVADFLEAFVFTIND